MTVRLPKYRHHKGSGQALVRIHGERIYLGKHGSEESKQKYRCIIAQYLALSEQSVSTQPASTSTELSINELILAPTSST